MSFIDYLIQNYIWLVAVLVIIIITIIGYVADRKSNKKKEQAMKKEVDQELVVDNPNGSADMMNMNAPTMNNDMGMQNWDNLGTNMDVNAQIPVTPDLNANNVNMNMEFDNNMMFPDPMSANVNNNMNASPMMDNYTSFSNVSPVDSNTNDINMSSSIAQPVQNNVTSDFSNMDYGFNNISTNINPAPAMNPEPIYTNNPIEQMEASPVIEPVPVVVPTPNTSVEVPVSETSAFVNPMPIPETVVSEPVYENEWDNVQTMEIPNIMVGNTEPVAEESEEDTDMWKL